MLVVLSDTHASESPSLPDHLAGAVDAATEVIHAGDFTAEAALDSFERRGRLTAVFGNSDPTAVRQRLPETATVEWRGLTVAVVHGHRRDATGLSLLAREAGADVVVRGHTHCPRIESLGERVLVNPGSHADPRGNRPGYAVVDADGDGARVELRSPTGECYQTRRL